MFRVRLPVFRHWQREREATMSLIRSRAVTIATVLLLLAGFVAEFLTREGPDYALHSWIGIALIGVIAVHIAGQMGWIKRVVKRGRSDPQFSLAVLNASLAGMVTICIITGFPAWAGIEAWNTPHFATGMLSILLAIVHLIVNRRRFVGLLRIPRSASR